MNNAQAQNRPADGKNLTITMAETVQKGCAYVPGIGRSGGIAEVVFFLHVSAGGVMSWGLIKVVEVARRGRIGHRSGALVPQSPADPIRRASDRPRGRKRPILTG
jgi:hypothetical protein